MLKTIHFKDQISAADKEVGDDERAGAIENSLALEGDTEALKNFPERVFRGARVREALRAEFFRFGDEGMAGIPLGARLERIVVELVPAAGRNGERDFHGEKRSNETHASTTDPDARLYKKSPGSAARLCHMGHVVMENRNGLVVAAEMTAATGIAEREAAVAMVAELADGQRITLGADKAYDTADFVAEMRRLGVTPHVSQNTNGRRSAIDRRTTRHPGYAISVRVRKRIEEVFGWITTTGGLRKTRHRGTPLVGWMFTLAAAAYNVVRIRKLLAAAT